MPREIWNEGRVVGYSAYETFVKQYISQDPNGTPPSEKQWLSASIGCGAAMLLRLDPVIPREGHDLTTIDIPLPAGSYLSAGNTIYASFFNGRGRFENGSPWAVCVGNYGLSISNETLKHPEEGEITQSQISTSTIPPDHTDVLFTADHSMEDYCKILDGVIIQPGTWEPTTLSPMPAMDFQPNYDEPPVLRLVVYGRTANSVYILFTGFTPRGVLLGVSSSDGSTATANPESGDFLGPAVYPWANKVVFTLPAGYGSMVQPKYSLYDLTYNSSQGAAIAKGVSVKSLVETDSQTKKMISLVDGSGNDYNLNGTDGKINATGAGTAADNKHRGELTWANLLEAVANNKSIDLAYDIIKSTGTGITVTRDTTGNTIGRYVISTNLTGGTGISVSGATINANIVAGDGITISHSDHTYTIKNAALDTAGYTTLAYAGDNAVPGANQYRTYKINNFTSGDTLGQVITTNPRLSFRIKKEYSGVLPRYRIKISGAVSEGGWDYRLGSGSLGSYNSTESDNIFLLKHDTNTAVRYQKSLILIIAFQYDEFYHVQADGLWQLEDLTGDGSTGFWNMMYWVNNPSDPVNPIRGTYGGSWTAVCKTRLLDTNSIGDGSVEAQMLSNLISGGIIPAAPTSPEHTCYLIVRGDSYIDGYNTQLFSSGWTTPLANKGDGQWEIFSENIHMDIECVLKKVQ